MEKKARPLIIQRFFPYSILVPVVPPGNPVRIAITGTQQQSYAGFLITTFVLSVAFGDPSSVWFGDASVNPATRNGIEIPPGTSRTFRLNNETQRYEVQAPLVDNFGCVPEAIPFTVWDLTVAYLAATTAPVQVGVVLFPTMFV